MSAAGKIYILRNPYLQNSLIKVGKTSRVSELRAKEISKATGVPAQFEVLYEEDVPDIDLAEGLIHDALSKLRVNKRREFFLVPLKTAVRTVFDVCRAVETIALGRAEPRIVLHVDRARTGTQLKDFLAPHLGGNAKVIVMFSEPSTVAMIELGNMWKVHFSSKLLIDLKRIGPGIAWTWGVEQKAFDSQGDDGNQFAEIPF